MPLVSEWGICDEGVRRGAAAEIPLPYSVSPLTLAENPTDWWDFPPPSWLVWRRSVGQGPELMPEPDPRLVALGRALRKARRERDLSQEALGRRAGMHPNHVGTIERGTKDLRATTLLRLIEALEMSPAELFADYAPLEE